MTVLEFKLLKAIAGKFAGITRNFSYEGFCLETQCVAFEPGDNLEISLRHPHSDLTVSVPAYVIWKKNSYKFACLMGIKLRETELDTKLRMLEIMSAAGDVPIDSFLSEGSDDYGTGKEDSGVKIPDLNLQPADKAAPEPPETVDEDTEPEEFMDEEPVSPQEGLFAGKKSVSTFDDVFRQAQAEGPEDEDMLNEEELESDMPWPKATAVKEKTAHGTNVLKKLLGNRIFIYSSSTVVLLAVSIYALSLIFKSPGISIKSPVPVPAQSTYRLEESLSRPVPPVDARDNKAEAPAIQQPDKQHISETESSKAIKQEVPAAIQPPSVINANDGETLYVQVGAWKHPDNAKEMLQKIKKYYPDAYLVAGTKFNKVKVPVKDKAQGKSTIKDIEDKFHIKPILTPEK